jgi:hypothetical protein
MISTTGENAKMTKRLSKEEMPMWDGMKKWNEECNKMGATIEAQKIATHWEPLVIQKLSDDHILMNTSFGAM